MTLLYQYGATKVSLAFGGKKQLSPWQFRPIPRKILVRKGGKLLLNRHELAARYGFLWSSHGDIGHSLSLGYGYRLGPFTLCGRALLGMSFDDETTNTKNNRFIGGDIYANWHYPLGSMTSSSPWIC